MSEGIRIIELVARERQNSLPTRNKKMLSICYQSELINVPPPCYNRCNSKSVVTKQIPFGRKEIQMPEIKVGDRYETKTNKYVGVVQEIAQNKNGSFRVRLDIDGKPHWTSAQGTVLN
jgi:hypothetical protein